MRTAARTNVFYVLLSRPDQFLPDKVTELLARAMKVPAIDARRMARRSWGFLGERMEEDAAKALVLEATRAGMDTLLLDESELALNVPVHRLSSGRCAEDGFRFTTGTDPVEKSVPWSGVRALCAAGLREEWSQTKTVKEGPTAQQKLIGLGITLATGLPVSVGKSKEVKKVTKESEFFLYMDLFVSGMGEGPVHLHARAEEFNFAGLGERMRPDVMTNFKSFLQDLAARSSGAFRNKGFQTLLAGQPFSLMGYDGSDDYRKEGLWLATLAARRAA